MEQLQHKQIVNTARKFPLIVISEALRTPQNVGMGMRVAEAFGVQTFYLNHHSPNTSNRLVQRTARNTEKKLQIIEYTNIIDLILTLKKQEYALLALEITNTSQSIHKYDFNKYSKIALLIGSERFGIQQDALDLCDESVQIDMYGNNSSMNVINSLSISLYEITKQLINKTNA